MSKEAKIIISIIAGVIFVVLIIFMNPFVIISAGERGVVLQWGKIDRILNEGLHWVTPMAEKVVKIDVRTQTLTFDQDAVSAEERDAMGSMGGASKDLQQVILAVIVNWHLIPDKVGDVYARYGGSFSSAVVGPIVRDSMKAASANFNAEELISKRAEFVSFAENKLREQFETKTDLAIFERVNVVDLDFSVDFNKAIELKVTAEQDALTAKNKLEQVKFEKEQRIAEAQGEAEAIRIQAQAITQQGGEDYVRLKAIEKWNGILPTQMIPGATVPFINLTK